MIEQQLLVAVRRDDALIWAARLEGLRQLCNNVGCEEAAHHVEELQSYWMRACLDQLSEKEIRELTSSDRMETYPEIIGEF